MAGDSRGIGRKHTSTSAFGISGRESHDSSKYYNSKLNKNQISQRNVGEIQDCPLELTDKIFCADSRNLTFLSDNRYYEDTRFHEGHNYGKGHFMDTWRVLGFNEEVKKMLVESLDTNGHIFFVIGKPTIIRPSYNSINTQVID